MIETDVLIVGSGPSGASAAALLSSYSVSNIVVTKYKWLADTPRAHITSQRTMEIFDELGVIERVMAHAVPNQYIGNSVICQTLVSEEIGRIKSWGAAPNRVSEYLLNSPFEVCDIPQNYVEPILIEKAAASGSIIKFCTEFISFEQDLSHVISTVKDRVSGEIYQIKSRYLVGADGGRSSIAESVGLPFSGRMGVAGSINIVFKADLTRFVAHRPSALFWMLNPEARVGGLSVGLLRMVRPWNEWLCVWSYDISRPPPKVDEEKALEIIKKIIGEDVDDISIKNISTWTVNDAYAKEYSKGKVFCVGDAVHRHPPNNGLGSNTSIQDSYNLAWKLAYVVKGWATERILETYSEERVPVGREIVRRANKSLSETKELLTVFSDGEDEAALDIEVIRGNSERNRDARTSLARSVLEKSNEFNFIGIESNISYKSSLTIADDEGHLVSDGDLENVNSIFHSKISPGARFPHVWLLYKGKEVSSLSLIGRGSFSLITGASGEHWIKAAEEWSHRKGIPLSLYQVSMRGEIQDIYFDLANRCDFHEGSAILIRPDGYIAWIGLPDAAGGEELSEVLFKILGK
ncbi:FAD-dependent monooxygenase [Paraburkholderia sp.]|uniref:FAD-dependent oxidoreductase n=1 Tax=Paraburkholderia sp. TaxID=1926495 RepID=UPI0025FB94BE|nr:FAD-dependent monooxygenase [Paraburkholderia sp.]